MKPEVSRFESALAVLLLPALAGAGLACLGLAWSQRGALTQVLPLGLAGLAGLAVAAWLAWRSGLARSPGAKQGLFWACLLWGLGLFAGLACWQESAVILGGRCFWLEDDALVSMRYAARLASGRGLTWTAGPRVEGYSDFLWTVFMALIHWLGASRALASAWVLAANAALLVWLAWATRRLAQALGAGDGAALLAGLACALSYDLLAGALSGLELVAVAAVMAQALAWGARADREGRPWPWGAFVLAGLLPLLRADGGLAAVLTLGLGLAVPARRRGGLWACLGAAVLVLGPGLVHEGFRRAYYGSWVPNTYVLKSGSWPGKYRSGALQLARALLRYPLVLLAVLAAWRLRAWRSWCLVLAALAGYCVWTGADYYPFLRFFAPGFALFFALGFASAERLAGAPDAAASRPDGPRGVSTGGTPRPLWSQGPGAGLCLALLVFSANAAWSLPRLLQAGWERGRERAELGLDLGRRIPPRESLAGCWAGAFFYFSGLPGVDLLGKNDAVVAAARPDPSLGGVGHDKLDLAHSFGALKPDWLLLPAPAFSPADRAYLISGYDQRIAAYPLVLIHCLPWARQVSDHWVLCHCHWSGPLGEPSPGLGKGMGNRID